MKKKIKLSLGNWLAIDQNWKKERVKKKEKRKKGEREKERKKERREKRKEKKRKFLFFFKCVAISFLPFPPQGLLARFSVVEIESMSIKLPIKRQHKTIYDRRYNINSTIWQEAT